jgi:hypothetical protein
LWIENVLIVHLTMVKIVTCSLMGIFGFIRRPQHQKFDYKPRYYDAVKEEREARMARYKTSDGTDLAKSRISSGLRRRSGSGYAGADTSRSNRRLVIILIVLAFLTYFFIQKYLPQIVDLLE